MEIFSGCIQGKNLVGWYRSEALLKGMLVQARLLMFIAGRRKKGRVMESV